MLKLWDILYNVLVIPVLWLFFSVYGLFNSKVREGLNSRRDLFRELGKSLSAFDRSKKNILIHCSSFGEYQQAIPFIDKFKDKLNIAVSFFSPSGFNNAKLPEGNVIKIYIPFDTKGNSKKLLDMLKPSAVLFIRYDLWFNLINECEKDDIPLYLANASDTDKTNFISRSYKLTLYRLFEALFVIRDKEAAKLSKELKDTKVKVILSGDSKIERVKSAKESLSGEKVIPDSIISGRKVIVSGSTWKDDDDFLLPVYNTLAENKDKKLLFVIVPHEPRESVLKHIETKISSKHKNLKSSRLSSLKEDSNLVIVDRIGVLFKIYRDAFTAYVGGGLRTGLHNVLEPAVFGIPVLFAKTAVNSDEHLMLEKCGCGMPVRSSNDIMQILNMLLDSESEYRKRSECCKSLFMSETNTAEIVTNEMLKKLYSEHTTAAHA